jgi:hypothetical protein
MEIKKTNPNSNLNPTIDFKQTKPAAFQFAFFRGPRFSISICLRDKIRQACVFLTSEHTVFPVSVHYISTYQRPKH